MLGKEKYIDLYLKFKNGEDFIVKGDTLKNARYTTGYLVDGLFKTYCDKVSRLASLSFEQYVFHLRNCGAEVITGRHGVMFFRIQGWYFVRTRKEALRWAKANDNNVVYSFALKTWVHFTQLDFLEGLKL